MDTFNECRAKLSDTIKNMTMLDNALIAEMVQDIPLQGFDKGTELLNQGAEPK